MTFLRELLANKPVRTRLDFGINDNIRLIKIDNEERKKDGEIIRRNTFITFAKFSSKNEVLASSEFSYYNLDPESDRVIENFSNQVAQLQNIANVLGSEETIDPTGDYESFDELEADLNSKKGCKKLMKKLWKEFENAVDGLYGEDSELLRLKVITDNKGKYLQLPREATVIEKMSSDCKLTISAYELKIKQRDYKLQLKQLIKRS